VLYGDTTRHTEDPEETSEMDQMTRHRMTTLGGPAGRLALAALAVGGLSATLLTVDSAGAATEGAAKSVVVSTAKSAKFGTILVSGTTLYTLKPSKTACTATCLKVWPALVLPKGQTKATAGSGVSASKLGTVTRSGGIRQVTYDGKALYWFSGDSGSGQVNGNITDEWGKWADVVTKKGSSSGSSTGGSTAGTGGSGF
jgi:predicted lipoprotein with Yx(FWY)xxD motif